MTSRPTRTAVGLLSCLLALSACAAQGGSPADGADGAAGSSAGTSGGPVPSPPPVTGAPPRPSAAPGPGEYLAGLGASVTVPVTPSPAVVVLVPGGGWATADPLGLGALAEHLTAAGLAVATITYGTSSTGAAWPVPADDVRCAVAYAAEQVPDVPVVLVGHSAGAHLSAVVGLAPEGEGGSCPYAPREAAGVVGLAGPYDVSATRGLAGNLFGVPEPDAPDLWAQGNPLLLAGERPDLPFLLVHGTADRVVGEEFARGFETALADGGHPVEVVVVDGATHSGVVRPDVVGDLVARWVVETATAS